MHLRTAPRVALLSLAAIALAAAPVDAGESADEQPFTLVVMDPLAAPLACDCVQGYAQRKYEKLGEYLQKQLGRKVKVVFNEALTVALKKDAKGRADLVIGKDSVVRADSQEAGVEVRPIAALTGMDGKITQSGLIVVRKFDAAVSPADLQGYRIFFGPSDCDEKSKAALTLLKLHGVKLPKKLETVPACSDGATKLMELKPSVKAATVISSYAQPLLEGCGTIKKGDLRIVGETKAVPFITAFVTQRVSPSDRKRIQQTLLGIAGDPKLLVALETRDGFVKLPRKKSSGKSATSVRAQAVKKKAR